MKKSLLIMLAAAVAFSVSGCKGTNEKRGDEHLEAGNYRNAINSYLNAKAKGSISDEFYDNFTRALIRAASVEAKKDPLSSLIPGYFDKAFQNLAEVKDDDVFREYSTTLANVGLLQVKQEGVDFATALNSFAFIDSAMNVAKKKGYENEVKAIRTEAEKAYVGANLSDAVGEEDPVVSEYQLLKLAELAPENPDVKAALNKSRVGTRGYFLIFGENIGERVSGRIDKWGYVMAFPTLKLAPGSLTGELQIWGSSGNNTEFKVETVKVVSTDGREAFAKQAGSGWCEAEVIVGKKGNERVEKKKQPFKGSGKLLNEFQCGVSIAVSYDKDFVPDYVEYKDEFGVGRKYLGQ